MLNYVKSPWVFSLLIAILTVIWVKFELHACLNTLRAPDGPAPEQAGQPEPERQAERQPEQRSGPDARIPPRTQERAPVPWGPGMPPPVEMGKAFTEVVEVEQDPLAEEEGAFETTE